MKRSLVSIVTQQFVNMRVKWVITFISLSACVDKINFNIPMTQSLIVVEGTINDSPGPYTVKLSKSISLDADSAFRDPIEKAIIKLYDDGGNEEDLTEISPGIYLTGGAIQGKIGHGYYIHITTASGETYQSDPDTINPVGEVQQIKYQFEAKTVTTNYGEAQADVFNVFVDADAGQGVNNYVRWRYTGTYKVETHPELHQTFAGGYWYQTPVPCSGYIVAPALGGGKLTEVAPCACCTCWVSQYESAPTLSDEQLVVNHQFRNVKVGEVPVNSNTFTDKFIVEVEQMSLTQNSFTFFNLIRAQKQGASSLFQPPSGKIIGNIKTINSSSQVVGIFWATSVKSKFITINRSDVPYPITPPDFIRDACTIFPNSATIQPSFWQ